MHIPQLRRRYFPHVLGLVALIAIGSQYMGLSSTDDEVRRNLRYLRSNEGEILTRAKPFDDLFTQRELASAVGDCVTLPNIHASSVNSVRTILNDLIRDAEKVVGMEADKPEVRSLGPGANYIVWDGFVGKGLAPEWLTDKPRASAWNATMSLIDPDIGLVRPIRWEHEKPGRVLEGNYVGFHNWINGNYAHLLMDHLPLMAWMDQEIVPPETKFILLDLPVTREVMSNLDPVFYENRLVWINPGELIHVKGNLTVAMPEKFPVRGFTSNLVSWLHRLHPEPVVRDKIIFYSRNSNQVHHGRIMDPKNEEEAIAVVRQKMSELLGRSGDELIIFNGLKENGEKMPFQEQFELFSTAATIIGPHGGGLANIVLSSAHPAATCSQRTQLLEFYKGQSLYTIFHGLPVDHHVMTFTQKSYEDPIFIDIQNFKKALDSLWNERKFERLLSGIY